jgi:hypothetical protein
MERVQKAGYLSDAIGCAIALADIWIAQGRLHEAMRTYERGLQLATEQGRNLARTCFTYTFPIPWTKNTKNLVRILETG